MLTLLIDSQPVTLPEDFTLEIHRENPLFFRSGDYTYDIELSLLDPDNRRLYDHIDRIQHTTSISHRSAVLIEGDTVLLNGTEAILEKTGDTVKIQILAGNAELNYLTGDETRIRSLNFGTVPTPTAAGALAIANNTFPQSNHVFPPAIKKYNFEEDTASEFINELDSVYDDTIAYKDDPDQLRPMPFFLYILETFIRLMGYTLTSNPYRNIDKWKRLLIIHGYDTLEYAKMLPDWTTAEFVEEVEKFLNCIILVDPITKECQLVSIPDFYASKPIAYIDNIVDDFDIAFDANDDHFFITYENLSYKLPSGTYWKYARLSKDVWELCTKVSGTPSTVDPSQVEDTDAFIVYDDISHLLFFVCYDTHRSISRYIFREVQQYRDYIRNPNSPKVEFRIIPCELHSQIYMEIAFGRTYALYPYPAFFEQTEQVGLHEAITGGVSDSASDIMQVAFYTGIMPFFLENGGSTSRQVSPQCFCNRCSINDERYSTTILDQYVPGAQNMNLSFHGTHGRVAEDFQSNYSIDTTHKLTIRFISDKYIDPVSIFQIQNKRYACRELKYTFKNGQRSNIVEGIFYPIS